MQVDLPDGIARGLSASDVTLRLAIGLFVSEEATLGQAASVAGIPQAQFLKELGKRRIPIHYGVEELEADLRAVDAILGR